MLRTCDSHVRDGYETQERLKRTEYKKRRHQASGLKLRGRSSLRRGFGVRLLAVDLLILAAVALLLLVAEVHIFL